MESEIITGVHVDASKAWIQTYSGGVFHILDPRQDEINIKDIGHSLAMQCRFTGTCGTSTVSQSTAFSAAFSCPSNTRSGS